MAGCVRATRLLKTTSDTGRGVDVLNPLGHLDLEGEVFCDMSRMTLSGLVQPATKSLPCPLHAYRLLLRSRAL